MFEKTKAFCDSFLERGIPGFDFAVYQNGKCILRHMNGYSDVENKIKINGTERYNIYSCSKMLTCVGAMQLWEKGLFKLEDELSKYMPEFSEMTVKTESGIKKAEKPILIRHLFEMTAGFSYAVHSPELEKARQETFGKCPTREVMKYLAKEPLLFEPGDRWEYSLCHDVLAALIEVISGEKFEDYIKKNIFDVVGMTNSTFMLDDNDLDSLAVQYEFRNGELVDVGKNIINFKIGSEYAAGGAGAISTVDDYIKFLEAVRKFELLRPETIKLMTTDRLTEAQKIVYWPKYVHGYGLGIRCPLSNSKLSDFGWSGAACAFMGIDPVNNLSFYFGAHLLASPVQGIRSMLYRFIYAELVDETEFENIYKELKELHNYNLTY